MATTTPQSAGGRIASELFRDRLRAAVGHSAAGKEVGYYPHRLAT